MKNKVITIVALILCFFEMTNINMWYSFDVQADEVAWNGTANTQWSGEGTAVNPYIIASAEDLSGLALMVNGDPDPFSEVQAFDYTDKYFVITSDIKLNNSINWTEWSASNAPVNKWIPIGNSSNSFNGSINFNGHKISGLYISGGSYGGVFGNLGEDSLVTELSVCESYIRGVNYIGGICGKNGGAISKCYFSGIVSATSYYSGGICGYNYGSLTLCSNSGNITASNNAAETGGIAGNNRSVVTNCYNTGNITVTGSVPYIGGICGRIPIDFASISNCYNVGAVTAGSNSSKKGSICGYSNTEYNLINNCYYISSEVVDESASEKSAAAFESGEVAYLLGIEYGQLLHGANKDSYPVFSNGSNMIKKFVKLDNSFCYSNDDMYIDGLNTEIRINSSSVNAIDIRYTFNFIISALPENAQLSQRGFIWGFNSDTVKNADISTIDGVRKVASVNTVSQANGSYNSQLVITSIPKSAFTKNITVKAFYSYILGENTYTVYSDILTSNVYDTAVSQYQNENTSETDKSFLFTNIINAVEN